MIVTEAVKTFQQRTKPEDFCVIDPEGRTGLMWNDNRVFY